MTARTVVLGLAVLTAMPLLAMAADVNYTCSGGTRLTAAFSPAEAGLGNVVLVIAGSNTKLTLPQVKSADGGRYANGDVEFWIRGRDATLTRAGRSETCQSK